MKHRKQRWTSVWMASLLALVLAAGAGCGNIDDSTPDSSTDQASHKDGKCTTIDGTVDIKKSWELKKFNKLDCFDIKGHLFVRKLRDIHDVDELHGLRSVTGYIGIARNKKLRNIHLPNLETTGKGLVFEGNPRLEWAKFPKLTKVGTNLHVFNNPKLYKASFPKLKKVGNQFIFASVDSLTKLKLPCLEKVGGKFIFEHSEGLKYLCLPQLRYVGKSFIVHFNPGLKALLAPKLKYIGRHLDLERNPKMVKVALDSLEKVKRNVKIVYNFRWSKCQIRKLIKRIDYIGGHKRIHDNYRVCRKAHIDPPAWCSKKACGERPDPEPPTCEDKCNDRCDKRCYKKCDGNKKCMKYCKKKCRKYCEDKCEEPDPDPEPPTCEDKCNDRCDKRCYKKCDGNKKCMKYCKKKCRKYCEDKCEEPDPEPEPLTACTLGFWKNHTYQWCDAYTKHTKVREVFDLRGFRKLKRDDMLDALRYKGGPGTTGGARILLRQATAAVLNACHEDVNYPAGVQRIVKTVNMALQSGDRAKMLRLAKLIDRINNAYECPLKGGPSNGVNDDPQIEIERDLRFTPGPDFPELGRDL